MTFKAEDGTGLPDANSYVTVAEADQYFLDRAVTTWVGTQTEKEAALIKATDYIDGRFGARFVGIKKTEVQALEWPRLETVASGIPIKLKYACMEYAIRALTKPLAPDLAVDGSGLSVVATKKKVGPIETEFAVAQSGLGATPMLFKPYPAADMLLRGMVSSARQVIRG